MVVPEPETLNSLSASAFADALSPLFEGAPHFLRRLAESRPFDSDAGLIAAAREVAASTPEEELVELLDAHPRIGADPVEMSASSRDDQQDGEVLGDMLAQELADLNAAYERRFGFRYVVFVAGRPRAVIAPLIEVALRNEREAELRRGVDDAIYIAGDRLRVLRGEGDLSEEVGA